MKTPDLSFVIPAYNAQDYLSDCVLSCLKQTHRNIEVVIVDDGSTDSTRRLIEHFAKTDTRVNPIFLPSNKGRGHARNVGNEVSTARLIAVLDSDDMAEQHRAENTIKLMDGCVLYGAASIVNSLGHEIGRFRADAFDLKTALDKQVNFIVHSTMAYPKSVTNIAKYDEGEYASLGLDDWKFQLDLALARVDFKHTEKILSAWRENDGQITSVRDAAKINKLKAQYLKKYAIKSN